jgi:hypothetical protein
MLMLFQQIVAYCLAGRHDWDEPYEIEEGGKKYKLRKCKKCGVVQWMTPPEK